MKQFNKGDKVRVKGASTSEAPGVVCLVLPAGDGGLDYAAVNFTKDIDGYKFGDAEVYRVDQLEGVEFIAYLNINPAAKTGQEYHVKAGNIDSAIAKVRHKIATLYKEFYLVAIKQPGGVSVDLRNLVEDDTTPPVPRRIKVVDMDSLNDRQRDSVRRVRARAYDKGEYSFSYRDSRDEYVTITVKADYRRANYAVVYGSKFKAVSPGVPSHNEPLPRVELKFKDATQVYRFVADVATWAEHNRGLL